MSKEYFYSRNICCSEITEHPDHYLAKFVICDFSVNGNQVALNRDTIESWMSTLVGNPLVGKLVVAPKGELDFSGHNMKVVTEKTTMVMNIRLPNLTLMHSVVFSQSVSRKLTIPTLLLPLVRSGSDIQRLVRRFCAVLRAAH